MFFGHIAVGLAAKPVAPKASLGSLLLSATAIDTLYGVIRRIDEIAAVVRTTGGGSTPAPAALLLASGVFSEVVR